MPELVGRSLGRYRIVEFLGAGGMGKVYRARDTTLDRDVAIKILSDAITQDPRHLERFQREARSLAQLSHPNILAIHDFRIDDGITYAVEELLEGRDLRHLVEGGGCSLREAVTIVCAVAEGLGAAHRKSIVHRDVKPENIFSLKTGGVKILDFGLARSFDPIDTEGTTLTERSELTSPGAVVGTASYMSPEQARGEELGPASDVFSLGVVFYELLTGAHPFRKDSVAETMASILREDPPAPSVINPNVPPSIDAVVGRCLEKQPDERFESARDIAFALKAISGQVSAVSASDVRVADEPGRLGRTVLAVAGIVAVLLVGVAAVDRFLIPPPLPDIKQITVARFEAAGDDPDLKVLAAGLSEVIAAGLEIVAEDSAEIEWVESLRFERRREPDDLYRAYRDYNVSVAVTAAVRATSDGVAFDFELIDTRDGSLLRRTRTEDSLLNPLAIQVSPVELLAQKLGVRLEETTIDRIRTVATDVPPALEPYLQGVGRLALADSAEDAAKAVELLDLAVRQDSRFDAARVAAARACLAMNRFDRDDRWLASGIERAEQAVSGNSVPISALIAVSSLQRSRGDLDSEVEALRRAVQLDPNHAEARRRYARALMRAGDLAVAVSEYQRAIYLQPGYWPNHHFLAQIFNSKGRYEAAATQFRRVIELAPQYAGGYTNLGVVYLNLGRRDEAVEIFERSLELDGTSNYGALTNLGAIYYDQRRFADAVDMFERALAVYDQDYRVWGNLASALSFSGKRTEAVDSYRRAIDLATVALETDVNNPDTLASLAIYHAALEEKGQAMDALAKAGALRPDDPIVVATIAECYEDLKERDRALEWVERAFQLGVSPGTFEDNPTLRDLVADGRFRALTAGAAS